MKVTEDKGIIAEESEAAEETAVEETVVETPAEEAAAEEAPKIEIVAEVDTKEAKADKKKTKKLESKLTELEKALEEKEKALAEQTDKYMRMMAEYDNFRKRSAKEREETYSDAYSDALTQLLPIIDNLERAVGVNEAEAVLKGLEMTLKGASDALEKLGVTAFGAKGDEFDPNMHNAVMTVESADVSEGQIVDVFQKGYKKGERIIRYAMVTVAN